MNLEESSCFQRREFNPTKKYCTEICIKAYECSNRTYLPSDPERQPGAGRATYPERMRNWLKMKRHERDQQRLFEGNNA